MKYAYPVLLLSLLLCFSSWVKAPKKEEQKFTVSGTIYEKHDYCSGVAPDPLHRNEAPFPAALRKLYIRQGNTNASSKPFLDSITSDSLGNFSIRLKAGTFCIVEAAKKDKCKIPANTAYSIVDTACYRSEYARCDYTLEVKENTGNVKIVLLKHCPWTQPCIQYNGPLPPAAPPASREKIGE